MTTQPEALRLAIQLEREWINDALNYDTAQNAWVELRRLHEMNQELLEALRELLWDADDCGCEKTDKWCPLRNAERIIAKLGEQP